MKKQPQWLTIATLRDGMLSGVQRLYYEDMLRDEMAEFLNQEHGSGNWIITPTDNLPENFDPATYTIENGQLVPASAEVMAARRQAEIACAQGNSGLVEQEVPGEFWPAIDGSGKKQVYAQTFTGNLAKLNSSIYVKLKDSGISAAWIYAYNINTTQWDIVSSVDSAFLRIEPTTGELAFVIKADTDNLEGKRYILTVKYTKK